MNSIIYGPVPSWRLGPEDHPGTPTMFVEKFGTPDGPRHFQAVEYKPPAELPDEQYPYVLTNGRSMFHYHTGSMTPRSDTLSNEVPRALVQVNPDDANKQGIKTNDVVILETRRGSIEAEANITEDVPLGLLFVPFHFAESCANVLTNPLLAPAARCQNSRCAVRIKVESRGDATTC